MDAEESKPVPKPTSVATVGEAFDVMVDASGVVATNADKITVAANFLLKMTKAFARIAIPIVVGLLLVVGGLILQIEIRDDKIARLETNVVKMDTTQQELKTSLTEAKDAALKAEIAANAAKSSLDAAIANSQQAGEESNDAIRRINEIYDTCVVRKEC